METKTFYTEESTSNRNGDYIKATRTGFLFMGAANAHDHHIETKGKRLENMDEKSIQPYKTVLAFTAIGVALVLGYVNAQNVKQSLVGIGFSENSAIWVGAGFTWIGLLVGEQLNDKKAFKLDEFTNKRKPTGKFWSAFIVAILYLGIQFFLALSASTNTSFDMQPVLKFTLFFSLFIALLELACGFMFVKAAIQTISLFFLNIKIRFTLRKMKSLSCKTEALWQRYLFNMQKANISPAEATEAVRKAREFYANGGFVTVNDSSSTE